MNLQFASFARSFRLFIPLLFSLSLTAELHAQIVLTSAASTFYSQDKTRVGVEVEFWNIHPKDAARVVAEIAGGTIQEVDTLVATTTKEIKEDGTRIYHQEKVKEYTVVGTKLGEVKLKVDFNQIDDVHRPDSSKAIVELVTEPIRAHQIQLLQEVMNGLVEHGAKGTDAKHAVSIQMNVEVNEGKLKTFAQKELADFVNLIRVVAHHDEQMREFLEIPKIRSPYLESFSPTLIKKMMAPNYRMDVDSVFVDVLYRQSLEALGDNKAWTMSDDEARQKLLSRKDPIVPKVVKQNFLRVSSLLMWLRPNDPLSVIYKETGWAMPRPLVEWRPFNNNFNVVTPFKASVGMLQAVEKYGAFDHDLLMRELTGMDPVTTKRLRSENQRLKGSDQPVLFRYFLGDAQEIDKADYAEIRKAYQGSVVGFLPQKANAERPLVIPGESIVFHRLPFHRNAVIGKYNPTLVNTFIIQALENKYTEARFWNEVAPGAMPETLLLADMIKGTEKIQEVLRILNTRFPKGWVLKGTWDLGSEKNIITDKTDFDGELKKYEKSGFDKFKAELDARYQKEGGSVDWFLYELKRHPGYTGWKLKDILSRGHEAIVQARMNLVNEFRVEVVAGKVLGGESTIDRYGYLKEKRGQKVDKNPAAIRAVEEFAQRVVSGLPEDMRFMTFGMDVALVKDPAAPGGLRAMMVESNPGGASNYLFEEGTASIRALEKRLYEVREEMRSGQFHFGKSRQDQMSYLKSRFAQWGIDPAKLYPGYEFRATELVDREYPVREAIAEEFEIVRGAGFSGGAVASCQRIFRAN